MKKGFESFKELYHKGIIVSVNSVSEIEDESFNRNVLFHLENNNSVYQIIYDCKSGAPCIFVYKTICFKIR